MTARVLSCADRSASLQLDFPAAGETGCQGWRTEFATDRKCGARSCGKSPAVPQFRALTTLRTDD